MLKNPLKIRGPSFEMPDGLGKVVFFEWRCTAPASHAHDPAGRAANVFPVAMGHRVGVCLPEKRLGQACQLGQRLRVDFPRRHPARFHGGRVKGQRILNFDPFGQEIRFELALNHGFPLPCRGRCREADQDNGEHQEKISNASFIVQPVDHEFGSGRRRLRLLGQEHRIFEAGIPIE